VSVRLIDAVSGAPHWARQFDKGVADVFGVQEAIAADVAAQLSVDIAATAARLLQRATNDSEAYQLYVTGRFRMIDQTPPRLRGAIEYFDRAVARDPEYALAYAAAAECYARLGVYGAMEPREAFTRARAAAERALGLDPELAEAHRTMGLIHMQYDWDWAASEQSSRRAIELNPQDAGAYLELGMLYMYRRRFDEALAHMRAAQERDPQQLLYSVGIANVLYHAHRYDESVRHLQHTLAMDESFDLAFAFLGHNYLRLGDADRAIAVFERRHTELPANYGNLVEAYALAGRKADAYAALAKMQERARTAYVPAYDFAAAYLALGEQDTALDWLERAFEERAQYLPHLPADPAFDPLHGNPRFERLVERLGL
jgi:tetratricopeptide (TPR) repeat protein